MYPSVHSNQLRSFDQRMFLNQLIFHLNQSLRTSFQKAGQRGRKALTDLGSNQPSEACTGCQHSGHHQGGGTQTTEHK